MTYWSRNSQISIGLGSSSHLRSELSESSSSMISLQRSMHSSQMYTPGPAMSFLTCFWLFPQKEHFSRSESPNFAMPPYLSSEPSGRARARPAPGILRARGCGCSKFRRHLSAGDDLVDDAVLDGLGGREDEVAVGVLRDALERLARVLRDQLIEEIAVPDHLAGLDLDVDGLTLRTAVRLVQEHPGVREGEPLTLGPGQQEHRRSRRRLPHADRRHVGLDVLHRVVDRE